MTPDDFVMDLGSGDGRIVIAAAKRGARAMGVEYNPDMVELSKRNAEKAGVSAKASFVNADLFATDLSQATVITMYLLPSLNLKLRPTILDLKPGTRIVAHAFNMGDWQCDKTVEKEGRTAYLWIVPAKVAGTWNVSLNPGNAELTLTQLFQTIDGTLKINGKAASLKNAKIDGSHIAFTCGDEEYSGIVNGKTIEGSVKAKGREQKWSASTPDSGFDAWFQAATWIRRRGQLDSITPEGPERIGMLSVELRRRSASQKWHRHCTYEQVGTGYGGVQRHRRGFRPQAFRERLSPDSRCTTRRPPAQTRRGIAQRPKSSLQISRSIPICRRCWTASPRNRSLNFW